MGDLFSNSSAFASLSLKDLVEARDLFHYHLMNKRNVVATALGLYRIRKDDPWPDRERPSGARPRSRYSERRTLFNSEVRPYSWPCVYVFVSDWASEVDLASADPSDVVPKALYLPDGRTVPVCVIEARKQPWSKDLKVKPIGATPRNLLGPGAALVNEDAQGMPRVATAGCIVRDAERYYALTNRHALGEPGGVIRALQGNREPRVGVAAKKSLGREDFHRIYPNFPSTRQRLLMDIGLVDVDDIQAWKTATPGIEPVGPVLDLYDNSLSLQLLTLKVVGYAAVSGAIRGEIHALFYRYKAMGGSEYLADFLIGPETKGYVDPEREPQGENVGLAVHHGDSGTVLFIEQRGRPKAADADAEAYGPPIYRPFAVLWGRQEFFEGGEQLSHPFALATSLATALDRLDLDYVEDLNRDQDYVWGWVGHYIIGRALPLAADLLGGSKLKAFIEKNLDRLAIQPGASLGNDPKVLDGPNDATPNFVPMADVPDNVWKGNVNFVMVPQPGGAKPKRRAGPGSRFSADNPNHFADLDLPYPGAKTFLEMNRADPATYLNPAAWIAYFAALKPKYDHWADLMGSPDHSKHWGDLSFRVHQLFDIMAAAAKAKDQALFLCAGGVLIHYIGDACQPLHASYLSQGDPDQVVTRPSGTRKLQADGVHSGYEDTMVAFGFKNDHLQATLTARIDALKTEAIAPIASGHDAAKAVIELIAATQQEIQPKDIVAKWVELAGDSARSQGMWAAFGDDTVTCMARGARYLTAIWKAAWDKGDGETKIGEGAVVGEAALMALYNDPAKCPSVALDHYPQTPADQSKDWSAITAH